jgi:hypothetical protein
MITPDNQPKPVEVPKPWNMETFGAYLNRTMRTPLLALAGLLGLGMLIVIFGRYDSFVVMQMFGGLPYIVVAFIGYLFYRKIQYRRLFWSEYAKYRGWAYLSTGSADVESAMMFHQGNHQVVTDVVSGTISNHPLTLCNYKFRIGYGKNAEIHSYTVVIVTFKGRFPHVYVDRLDHGYGLKVGRALPLPNEVSKQFKIFAPPEYEIEALAIFDPEILAKLLDLKYNFDMELIDQKLYVFMPQMIDSKEVLEQRLQQAESLLEELIPHLDHTNYQPIPNMPDRLH